MTIDPLWRVASRGRPSTWVTPEETWEDAVAYFQWADANPLQEEKLHMFQGEIIRSKVDKIRPYTIGGFQLHAGISDATWYKYKNDSRFSGVIEQIEKCIKEQKFAGAVAELMNPNIIARDLGLSDKHEVTGADGGAIRTESITAAVTQQDAAEAYQRMIKG